MACKPAVRRKRQWPMTTELTPTTNVLLLNFVDFRPMPIEAGRQFYKKLQRASDEEVARALALLREQTGGVMADHWITEIAVAMLKKLKLNFTVARINLSTGEQ